MASNSNLSNLSNTSTSESISSYEEQLQTFAREVGQGLRSEQKHLSSKYFYDDLGSRIFQKIMDMPEYYLTNAEWDILSEQGSDIYKQLNFDGTFHVIELGAGDGIKTMELLKHFTQQAGNENVVYMPIDISQEAIDAVSENVAEHLPDLPLEPWVGDYADLLDTLPRDKPNLFLFLGSNIGNFSQKAALKLLSSLYEKMKSGDKLLIGMDLQKNPKRISQAYDDPHGITRSFNLNLLNRINGELDGSFKVDQFDFYCHYNPMNGEVRSYLVSLQDQEVFVGALEQSFSFRKDELIWTELSKKYSFTEIETLAEQVGFRVEKHFLDSQGDFVDSLWTK